MNKSWTVNTNQQKPSNVKKSNQQIDACPWPQCPWLHLPPLVTTVSLECRKLLSDPSSPRTVPGPCRRILGTALDRSAKAHGPFWDPPTTPGRAVVRSNSGRFETYQISSYRCPTFVTTVANICSTFPLHFLSFSQYVPYYVLWYSLSVSHSIHSIFPPSPAPHRPAMGTGIAGFLQRSLSSRLEEGWSITEDSIRFTLVARGDVPCGSRIIQRMTAFITTYMWRHLLQRMTGLMEGSCRQEWQFYSEGGRGRREPCKHGCEPCFHLKVRVRQRSLHGGWANRFFSASFA